MNLEMELSLARRGAARHADADDAAVWRWVADLMEERRLVWRRQDEGWAIVIDGVVLACGSGFDDAMRAARSALAMRSPAPRRW